MAELKLRSKDPDSLRRIIQSALSERLQSVVAGIKRTEERIQEFETNINYQLRNLSLSLIMMNYLILLTLMSGLEKLECWLIYNKQMNP